MTRRKEIELVVPASAFASVPKVGTMIASVKGTTCTLVHGVRAVRNNGAPAAYRIFGARIKTANLPPDAIVLPCPKRPRPNRAAEPPPMGPFPVTTQATARKQQRAHVIELLREDRANSGEIAPAIQQATGKVEPVTIRDPDDLNPHRRHPKMVASFRSTADPVRQLVNVGCLSRRHGVAAERLRRDYELGVFGMSHGVFKYEPDRVQGVGAADGPSAMQGEHLEYFQRAEAAVGPRLFAVLVACIISGQPITDYATKLQINRQNASGRLIAACDRLLDHYDVTDAPRRDAARAPSPRPD